MLVASRAWLPLWHGKQGSVFVANHENPHPNQEDKKRTNKSKKIQITKTNVRGQSWHLEFGNPEWKRYQIGGDFVEVASRHLWCAGTRAYGFLWTQQDLHFKSGTSLIGSFFSSWSSARQFFIPLGVRTLSGPTWNWKGMFLQPTAIRCCQGPSQLVTGMVMLVLLLVCSVMLWYP